MSGDLNTAAAAARDFKDLDLSRLQTYGTLDNPRGETPPGVTGYRLTVEKITPSVGQPGK